MEFYERLGWWLLGCAVGFIFGYIVRSLREIKEGLEEVDENVKRRDDDGFTRYPLVTDVALLVVVALTVWAAFSSQAASNNVKETQNRLARLTVCNQEYLSRTISTLNERTAFTEDQVRANVDLQKNQAEFWNLLLKQPPDPEKERREAAEKYTQSLTDFVRVSEQTRETVRDHPFPTSKDLLDCLESRGFKEKP